MVKKRLHQIAIDHPIGLGSERQAETVGERVDGEGLHVFREDVIAIMKPSAGLAEPRESKRSTWADRMCDLIGQRAEISAMPSARAD